MERMASGRATKISGYSLEVTAKDVPALVDAAPMLAAGTPVSITFLPGETMDARISAALKLRELGFEPVPHISARRLSSKGEFTDMIRRCVEEAQVKRLFVVAGDPSTPAGPFGDSLSLIGSGLLERSGIERVGIAGHPEGHPIMDQAALWHFLKRKHGEIVARGMRPVIVTQFGFSADPFLDWLEKLRAEGIDCLVRIGVPGPASIKTLLRFAKYCGVAATSSVMARYGVSLTKLLSSAGPDKLVDDLTDRLGPAHGNVRLHFYPFGGLAQTVGWIADYGMASQGGCQ